MSLSVLFTVMNGILYGQAPMFHIPPPAGGVSASQIARAAAKRSANQFSLREGETVVVRTTNMDRTFLTISRDADGNATFAIFGATLPVEQGRFTVYAELRFVENRTLHRYDMYLKVYNRSLLDQYGNIVPDINTRILGVDLKEALWDYEVDEIVTMATNSKWTYESFSNKIMQKIYEQTGTRDYPSEMVPELNGHARIKWKLALTENEVNVVGVNYLSDYLLLTQDFENAMPPEHLVRFISAEEFASYRMGLARFDPNFTYFVKKPVVNNLPYIKVALADGTFQSVYIQNGVSFETWNNAGGLYIKADPRQYYRGRLESATELIDGSGHTVAIFDRSSGQFKHAHDPELMWTTVNDGQNGSQWIKMRPNSTTDMGSRLPGEGDPNTISIVANNEPVASTIVDGHTITYVKPQSLEQFYVIEYKEIEGVRFKFRMLDLDRLVDQNEIESIAIWSPTVHHWAVANSNVFDKFYFSSEITSDMIPVNYEIVWDEGSMKFGMARRELSGHIVRTDRRLVYLKEESLTREQQRDLIYNRGFVEYDPATGEPVALIKPVNQNQNRVTIAAEYDKDLMSFVEQDGGARYIWVHVSNFPDEVVVDLPIVYGIENYRRVEDGGDPGPVVVDGGDSEPEVDRSFADMQALEDQWNGQYVDGEVKVGYESADEFKTKDALGTANMEEYGQYLYNSDEDKKIDFDVYEEESTRPPNELLTEEVQRAQADQMRLEAGTGSVGNVIQSENTYGPSNFSESERLNLRLESAEEEIKIGDLDVNAGQEDIIELRARYFEATREEAPENQDPANRLRPDYSDCE